MINARPPLATASNFAANKTNEAQQHQQQQQQQQQQHQQQQQQQHQQQQQNLLLQHFQQQHKPPVAMSSPKIRVNPNTQNPTTSQVSNVLQQLQNDTFNNNNNNNNNNPQMTSLLENKSNTASNSNNSNGLMSALQLTAVSNNSTNSIQNLLTSPARMQWLVMPAGSSTPNNGSPSTPSKSQQELMQSIGLTNVNNTSKQEPNTSPACSLRPPMRRRVRRKGSSPDDQAEQLTEMSVRGLNLFRYASICDGVYQCTECLKDNVQKTFKNKYSFQRHAFLYHEGTQRKVFPCPLCGKEFSRPDKMKNHMKTTHEGYMPKDFPLTGDGTQLPQVVGQPSTSPNKSKLGDKKPLLLQPHQLMSSENMYSLAQTQLQLQQIQAHLQIQQQKQSHNFGMMSPQGKQGSPDPSASPNGPQDQRPSPIESPLLVPKTEDLTIDLDDGESSSPLPFNVDEIQSSTLLQTEQENVA